jgi:large repetitive protein
VKKFRVGLVVAALVVVSILGGDQHAFAAGKITVSPSSVTMAEGSSQDVSITLSQPVTCGGPPSCSVDLSFASSDSDVTVSPVPVSIPSAQWSQPFTLTITSTNDGTYTGGKNVTLTATATSASAFYNGYAVTIPVTVTDAQTAPSPNVHGLSRSLDIGSSTRVDVLTGVSGNPDASTLAITSDPIHGTAAVAAPNIVYTPNQDFVGSDQLTYKVCSSLDTTACSSANLTFTVVPKTPDTGVPSDGSGLATSLIMGAMLGALVGIITFVWYRTRDAR